MIALTSGRWATISCTGQLRRRTNSSDTLTRAVSSAAGGSHALPAVFPAVFGYAAGIGAGAAAAAGAASTAGAGEGVMKTPSIRLATRPR